MSNLWNDISADLKLLMRSVADYGQRGIALAHAECDYRVILAKNMLEERANGTPATILRDVCLGKQEVATARLNRDCAKALHDSCREGIMAVKLQIKINSEQYAREWGNQ